MILNKEIKALAINITGPKFLLLLLDKVAKQNKANQSKAKKKNPENGEFGNWDLRNQGSGELGNQRNQN